jgi:hypothetical protein
LTSRRSGYICPLWWFGSYFSLYSWQQHGRWPVLQEPLKLVVVHGESCCTPYGRHTKSLGTQCAKGRDL